MYQSTKRTIFIIAGIVSLLLGIIGIFLPLVPTTPFILLASILFSKSSERLHRWLLNQPRLGPLIKDWEQYGVIRIQIKIISTLMILLILVYPIFFLGFPFWVKGIVVGTLSGVLIFIWTRPSRAKESIRE